MKRNMETFTQNQTHELFTFDFAARYKQRNKDDFEADYLTRYYYLGGPVNSVSGSVLGKVLFIQLTYWIDNRC